MDPDVSIGKLLEDNNQTLINFVRFSEVTKIAQEELFLKIGILIQTLHGSTLFLKAFEDPLQFYLLVL